MIEGFENHLNLSVSFFYSKNEKLNPEIISEHLDGIQESEVLADLTMLKPRSQYRLSKTGEYAINKLVRYLRT